MELPRIVGTRRAKAAALALLLSLVSSPSYAQPDPLATRILDITRHPNDSHRLCDTGWAAFLLRRDALATQYLDRGLIALAAEPATRPNLHRLAACLYSRGRVDELEGRFDQAIPRYERSLALRDNDVVRARLASARARTALGWRPVDRGEPDAALATALQASSPRLEPDSVSTDDVLVRERLAAPDGRQAVLVDVRSEVVLAVRARDGAWSAVRVASRQNPNGSVDFSMAAAPSPDEWPTFLITEAWSHRECCDDEGYPDWSEGQNYHLAWRDAGGALRAASLEDNESLPDVPVDVTFTEDGRVALERPGDGVSARVRRLLGPHDREAWLDGAP